MIAAIQGVLDMRPVPSGAGSRRMPPQRWVLEELPWGAIRRDAIVGEEELFYLLVSASFIKTAAGLHARGLARYFSTAPGIADWLEHEWQQDELQHATALKRYIQTVWPQFDWDSAYEFFFSEFAVTTQGRCAAGSRSLEMAACCALEMAAASYYSAIRALSREPLLRLLAWHISADAMLHHQRFYRLFNEFRGAERATRNQVMRAMWQRLKQVNNGVNAVAMKHVYGACHPDVPLKSRGYGQMQKRCRRLIGQHVPRSTGVRMALMPLDLGPRLEHMASPILGMVITSLVT